MVPAGSQTIRWELEVVALVAVDVAGLTPEVGADRAGDEPGPLDHGTAVALDPGVAFGDDVALLLGPPRVEPVTSHPRPGWPE